MINYYNQAKEKIKLHDSSMKNCKIKSDILSILNIGLISFVTVANEVFYNNKDVVITTLFSGILFGSLVVTGIQKYFNFEELVEKHKVSSLMYSVLVQNIDDENIPPQYIRSQYQFLKAMEPYVEYQEEHQVNFDNICFELARSRDS
jgi:hypothetical protein